mgnify:CR=1 FL=1|tara:strand:+ start:12424 stop:12903 length:480 start_codon:yes stop_codon:yes gene_type:complete
MNHIVRIHLEHKKDVIRDLKIPSNKSLEDLHHAIIKALEIEENEMASFYMTNENLELLQEIPLFKIDEKDNLMLDMSEIRISSILTDLNSQLIYIYDFLKMWRFLISYQQETKDKANKIEVINSIGDMPKEAPEIIFSKESDFSDDVNTNNIYHEKFDE